MKIIFVGDSPTVSTGFARCTRIACNALIAAGHDVIVLGMGYYGDPHGYPYPIYPCFAPLEDARSYGGESRLPSLIAQLKPDVVVILQDPWNIPNYFGCIDAASELCRSKELEFTVPPIVGWIAIDGRNQKGFQLDRLSRVMVWTEFARNEIVAGGCRGDLPFDLVTLGVDLTVFYPQDHNVARQYMGFDSCGIPLDSFVVGVVGRNQPRKQLILTLSYFSSWVHEHDIIDAYLYLHVAPTGERSCDIKSLISFFDLRGRVIIASPDIGIGCDENIMRMMYNSFDVYMTQSQAEGFGLPALEAMACGIPCILPDHSAFGPDGWVSADTALKIECDNIVLSAPLGSGPYIVGSIPNKDMTINRLQMLYDHPEIREVLGSRGREIARRMSWANTGDSFVIALEAFMSNRSQP